MTARPQALRKEEAMHKLSNVLSVLATATLVVVAVGCQAQEETKPAQTPTEQETPAPTSTPMGTPDLSAMFVPTQGARAMVAAKLKQDEPAAGSNAPWPCRLIHADPNLALTDPYEIYVTAGAPLILVNLSDEKIPFTFGANLFVEPGNSFTVPPSGVKLLTLKQGLSPIGQGGPRSVITLGGNCFKWLPGPKLYLP